MLQWELWVKLIPHCLLRELVLSSLAQAIGEGQRGPDESSPNSGTSLCPLAGCSSGVVLCPGHTAAILTSVLFNPALPQVAAQLVTQISSSLPAPIG